MSLNDIITPELIEEAKELGACEEALIWLCAEPRTAREVINTHAGWLLDNTLDRLSDEQFDMCVEKAPRAALVYALDRLSDEQFDMCAGIYPLAASTYASGRLTPEQAAWCRGNR